MATAAAPRDPGLPAVRLLNAWFCPFAQRAWIALEEAGVDFENVQAMSISKDEVNYDKTPELLEANPNGLVPTVLRFDENGNRLGCVYESMICVEYVHEALWEAGGKAGRIFPENVEQRARCRIWIDFVGKKLVPPFYRMLVKTDEAEREEAKQSLREAMVTFAQAMPPATDGPFFLGKEFSAVDISFAPWAHRMFVLQHYRAFDWHAGAGGAAAAGTEEEGAGNRESTLAGMAMARFDVWMGATLARSSVVATLAEHAALIGTYKRYADNVTTSQVAESVRAGRALP